MRLRPRLVERSAPQLVGDERDEEEPDAHQHRSGPHDHPPRPGHRRECTRAISAPGIAGAGVGRRFDPFTVSVTISRLGTTRPVTPCGGTRTATEVWRHAAI